MLSPRKTTWGIIGACFLAFFVASEAKAFTTSFEAAEGYSLGEINGQENWTYPVNSGTHDVSAGARHTGEYSLEMSNANPGYASIKATFATSSTYTQCFAYKAEATSFNASNIISITPATGGSNCGAMALDTKVRVWDGNSYEDIEEPSFAITPNNWMNFCISYDDNANWIEYYASNGYVEAISRINTSPTNGGCSRFQIDAGRTSGTNNRLWFDSFASVVMEQSEDWDFSAIEWDFPQQDYVINTSLSTTTSWTFYYDLAEADAGTDGNLISVVWTGSDYWENWDYEEVATTSSVTLWQVERARELPLGTVFAKASLIALDDCLAGGGAYDTTCIWREVAYTDQISFLATSTGGASVFYNPWDRPPGFYAATTTAEDEEDSDLIKSVVAKLKNVFPLSIMFQVHDIFKDIRSQGTVQPVSLKLQDLMPDAGDAILGSTNPELLSYHLLRTNLTQWDTIILPFMNFCVYLIAFFFGLFLIFPKLRSIDLGGHQQVGPDKIGTLYENKSVRSMKDIRPASVGHTADLRYKYPKGVTDLRYK